MVDIRICVFRDDLYDFGREVVEPVIILLVRRLSGKAFLTMLIQLGSRGVHPV
ncbi:hypothetical protein [Pararhizobium antarcticum]|uniref:hypothetical protein n=1 Tax=Pararhizobium antarcticum TaxID=1798805 RepID=UPI0015876EAC|nr:hypothetical protein [Pararhizobium antarcticum]